MNDNAIIIIGLACCLVGLVGVIFIPMIILLMRGQRTIADVSGARMREEDRIRRDLYDSLSRMIEKNTVAPVHAMQQHSLERMERVRMDTSLQREEVKQPPPQVIRTPGNPPVDDVTLAME